MIIFGSFFRTWVGWYNQIYSGLGADIVTESISLTAWGTAPGEVWKKVRELAINSPSKLGNLAPILDPFRVSLGDALGDFSRAFQGICEVADGRQPSRQCMWSMDLCF